MENPLGKYEPVIGLEIHAQLTTNTKAYSSDINEYGALPNTNVSPVTLGHPGTLPRFNKKSIEYAVKLGLACNADITRDMHFDRKNYFYADLPKGYQITQDKTPICTGGKILIKGDDGNEKAINLTRIHMEEDSGKSIHDMDPFNTLVDLNRAGTPLVEIVTEPELKSGDEAYSYLTEVRKLLRYLEICDGNMEEGSMRCDVNISIMPRGSKEFGQRVEIKNMNSIRNVQRAIAFEINRHADLLEEGGKIAQETRNFDATTGSTVAMRKKEDAHDYRYFPEPDLTALHVTQGYIDAIHETMPALPNDLFKKYVNELGLSEYDALNLTDSKGIALYFEELISHCKNYKTAANWMMGAIKSHLNQNALEIDSFLISPEQIAGLINIIEEGKISHSVAEQKVFPELLANPEMAPIDIATNNNWIQKSDTSELEDIIRTIFKDNPSEVERFKNGEKKLTGFFMGQIMKETRGAADPKATAQILNKLVNEN